MILNASVILLGLLVGANASALKGRHEQPPELVPKRLGPAGPFELFRNQQKQEQFQPEHRELSKITSQQEEQRRDEGKLEDPEWRREEIPTQIEEQQNVEQLPTAAAAVKAPPLRPYEAKPQLRASDESPKGQPAKSLLERRDEEQPQEQLRLNQPDLQQQQQQREESPKSTEATNGRTEQVQVVDLKPDWDQQRRLEVDQPTQQQVVRYDEPLVQQQVVVRHEEQRTPVDHIIGPCVGPPEAEPYAFDYSIEGSSRRETGDVHGVVRGQYTVLNGDGSQRVVDYIADRDGFRAQINTGELGTENQQPAGVLLRSSQPAAQDISLHLEGKTREFLTAVPQAPAAPLVSKTVSRPDNWNLAQPQQAQREAGSEWEPQAVKGGKESELIKEDDRAPILISHPTIKSTVQRIEEATPPRQEPLKQELSKQESLEEEPLKQEPAVELPVKKAELKRTPKAIAAEPRSSPVIRARASFESATAHRPIVHSFSAAPVATHQHHHHNRQHHHHSQPTVVHRHQPHHHDAPAHHHVHVSPLPPVRAFQLAHGVVPSRAQLQHDRYPPPQPLNPRVSFYSANNFDDEQPASVAGFRVSDQLELIPDN